jgi:hypothetical protein
MMVMASPVIPSMLATTTPDSTVAVGTPPFGLSNHEHVHFNNSNISMVAPTVDVTVPTTLFNSPTTMMVAASPFSLACQPIHELFQLQMRLSFPLLLGNNIYWYLLLIRTRSFIPSSTYGVHRRV